MTELIMIRICKCGHPEVKHVKGLYKRNKEDHSGMCAACFSCWNFRAQSRAEVVSHVS